MLPGADFCESPSALDAFLLLVVYILALGSLAL